MEVDRVGWVGLTERSNPKTTKAACWDESHWLIGVFTFGTTLTLLLAITDTTTNYHYECTFVTFTDEDDRRRRNERHNFICIDVVSAGVNCTTHLITD